jgi:dTMP kinase
MSGIFITIEGGEGTGKTTLIKAIENELTVRGFCVVTTREPGGSSLGEHIRTWLLNRDASVAIGSHAELLLFLAGRAQHIEELIQPSLARGCVVLCDRFNDSTIVYQGIARNLGQEYVAQLCSSVCRGIDPHLTFVLDLDPGTGLARSRAVNKEHAAEGELDRIESEALHFHEKVRKGFLDLAQQAPHRCKIIDAAQSKERVFLEAISALEKVI